VPSTSLVHQRPLSLATGATASTSPYPIRLTPVQVQVQVQGIQSIHPIPRTLQSTYMTKKKWKAGGRRP
jgi:hypothetical protein